MYRYQRIKDLRNDADMIQEEMAEIIGTSQKQYSRWERGESEIPLHKAKLIADYFGVTLDYLTEKMEMF